MKRQRLQDYPEQLSKRIAFREITSPSPATTVAKSRLFSENLVPSAAIPRIEPPPNTCICRFTPCGKYLITFDVGRNDVVLYRYIGCPSSVELQQAPEPPFIPHATPQQLPAPPKFTDFFQLHARCSVTSRAEEQLFSFSLIAYGRFLIVASSSPDGPPDQEGWLSVAESTTFHLLDLEDGQVLDRYTISNDCVELTGNQAASLYDDLLAVLALASQSIYLLRVLPTGKFVYLQTIGKDCHDDDRLIISQAEQAEVHWRALQSRSVPTAGVSSRISPELGGGSGGGYLQPGPFSRTVPQAAPASSPLPEASAGPSRTSPLLQQQQQQQQRLSSPQPLPAAGGNSNEGLRIDGSTSSQRAAGEQHLLQGVRQRLLTYLYLEAKREMDKAAEKAKKGNATDAIQSQVEDGGFVHSSAPGQRALDAFYYFFDTYSELVMTRVHLLDRERLLLQWNSPEWASTLRSGRQGLSFKMIYNRTTTAVEHLFKASDAAEFLAWAKTEPGLLHGGAAASDWDKYATPTLGERKHKEPHVDDIPLGCQTRQATPYLDSRIYHYDERFITPDTLPKQLPHRPVKFMCQHRPERLRFKFEPDDIAPVVDAGRVGVARSHDVFYLFHPHEPFVLIVVDDAESGLADSVTVYTRSARV